MFANLQLLAIAQPVVFALPRLLVLLLFVLQHVLQMMVALLASSVEISPLLRERMFVSARQILALFALIVKNAAKEFVSTRILPAVQHVLIPNVVFGLKH
jgi:hypothetical protein